MIFSKKKLLRFLILLQLMGASLFLLNQVMALSRDTCKNRQDGLGSLTISQFQRFQVEDLSLPPMAAELTVNLLYNLRIF